ncbi:MAG: hypothetical protein JWM38_1412 [Sphingomonas bacterium]|nr:hypothetical protein [Sphingomonas bacterium]
MNPVLLVLLAGSAFGTPPPSTDARHSIQLDYRGTPVEVVYEAISKVRHKQIGAAPPTRSGTVRCTWTATIDVTRRLAGSPAGSARTISSEQPLRGSRHGDCMTNRRAIAKELAAQSPAVRSHLLAVAERDRPQLHAELDAARNLVAAN